MSNRRFRRRAIALIRNLYHPDSGMPRAPRYARDSKNQLITYPDGTLVTLNRAQRRAR